MLNTMCMYVGYITALGNQTVYEYYKFNMYIYVCCYEMMMEEAAMLRMLR